MADPTISEQPQPLETIDPSTGFQPQQLPSPQPDAPPPAVGNVNPDAFSSQPAQVGGPAPQVSQAPQPFWKTLLRGALAGLAGGAGAHNWGQALGGGAAGEMKMQQQDFENQQQQQAQASQIRFRDAQDAYNAAMLHQHQTQLDMQQGQERRATQAAADTHAKFLENMGATVTPVSVGASGDGPATAFLTAASNNGGADVNGWTVPGPDTMYHVAFNGDAGPAKQYAVLQTANQAFGLPVPDRATFLALPRQKQMLAEQLSQQYLLGSKSDGSPYKKGDENILRTDISNASDKLKQLNSAPEESRDASAIQMWQTRLSFLNRAMQGMDQTNDAATKRQMSVADARGRSINDNRYNDFIDPNTGQIVRGTNKQQVAAGATSANGTTINAAKQDANITDVKTGLDTLQQSLAAVPKTGFSPAKAAALNYVIQGATPEARQAALTSAINNDVLSPSEQRYATSLISQLERQLSLRGLMSLGQGSEDQRRAIQNNLPMPTDAPAQMAQKMHNAYQQEKLLEQATPHVRGLTPNGPAASQAQTPQRPAGVPANAQWDAQRRIWHL